MSLQALKKSRNLSNTENSIMTTAMKAKLNKSNGHTKIDKHKNDCTFNTKEHQYQSYESTNR